jgi:hypothetical protein
LAFQDNNDEHPPATERYYGHMDAETAEDGTLETQIVFVLFVI